MTPTAPAVHLVFLRNTNPTRFALYSFSPCRIPTEQHDGVPVRHRNNVWTLTTVLGSSPANRAETLRALCEPYLTLRATLTSGDPTTPTRSVKPLLAEYDDVPSDPALLEQVCLGAPDPKTLWEQLGPLSVLTRWADQPLGGTLSLWLVGSQCL